MLHSSAMQCTHLFHLYLHNRAYPHPQMYRYNILLKQWEKKRRKMHLSHSSWWMSRTWWPGWGENWKQKQKKEILLRKCLKFPIFRLIRIFTLMRDCLPTAVCLSPLFERLALNKFWWRWWWRNWCKFNPSFDDKNKDTRLGRGWWVRFVIWQLFHCSFFKIKINIKVRLSRASILHYSCSSSSFFCFVALMINIYRMHTKLLTEVPNKMKSCLNCFGCDVWMRLVGDPMCCSSSEMRPRTIQRTGRDMLVVIMKIINIMMMMMITWTLDMVAKGEDDWEFIIGEESPLSRRTTWS